MSTHKKDGVNRREFFWSSALVGFGLIVAGTWLLEGCEKSKKAVAPLGTYQGSDEQLLDEIEKTSFQFFWEQAHPKTGLIKDRANVSGSDNYTAASIAAVGFGLPAL